MLSKMLNKKGFTMVELLVVLVIIAILAAVATPIYLANTQRAKVSEAVATISLIRQVEREYNTSKTGYFDVVAGNIMNPAPDSAIADGTPTPATAGAAVQIGPAQYFPAVSYTVNAGTNIATAPASTTNYTTAHALFTNPVAQNYVIYVDGSQNTGVDCTIASPTNCGLNQAQVTNFRLAMDDTGRTFVCYGTCGTAANWTAY